MQSTSVVQLGQWLIVTHWPMGTFQAGDRAIITAISLKLQPNVSVHQGKSNACEECLQL
jgi:hypothetical protein